MAPPSWELQATASLPVQSPPSPLNPKEGKTVESKEKSPAGRHPFAQSKGNVKAAPVSMETRWAKQNRAINTNRHHLLGQCDPCCQARALTGGQRKDYR